MIDDCDIRIGIVREAVDELWGKMADMQAGMPLSSVEWQAALANLVRRIERLRASGNEWRGSSSEGS